ncbi:MAG: alpha/beta hydrolase [Saprospiraceae bacterium]|nr:alpha/beta hydrolase [Saprospiraceae bacterium]
MNKKNLLLLHGALGCKKQFESLKELLANEFNIYDLNFEGHGGRLSDKEFSIDLFAKNTLEYIQEIGLERTNIFGYSMGGYVALKLASENSDFIERIITLGTKFNWNKEVAEKEIRMLDPIKVEEKVPSFAKQLENLHYPCDWKEIMNKTSRMMIDLGNGNKLSDDNLKQISIPTLIGVGELDNMVTVEESKNVSDLLQNAKLRILEGFKHPLELIPMDKLAKLILDFTTKD